MSFNEPYTEKHLSYSDNIAIYSSTEKEDVIIEGTTYTASKASFYRKTDKGSEYNANRDYGEGKYTVEVVPNMFDSVYLIPNNYHGGHTGHLYFYMLVETGANRYIIDVRAKDFIAILGSGISIVNSKFSKPMVYCNDHFLLPYDYVGFTVPDAKPLKVSKKELIVGNIYTNGNGDYLYIGSTDGNHHFLTNFYGYNYTERILSIKQGTRMKVRNDAVHMFNGDEVPMDNGMLDLGIDGVRIKLDGFDTAYERDSYRVHGDRCSIVFDLAPKQYFKHLVVVKHIPTLYKTDLSIPEDVLERSKVLWGAGKTMSMEGWDENGDMLSSRHNSYQEMAVLVKFNFIDE